MKSVWKWIYKQVPQRENITGSYKIQEAVERHDHTHPKGYSILRWMWTEGEMKGKQKFVDCYIHRLQNTSTKLQKQEFKMLEVQRKHLILSLLEEWENFFLLECFSICLMLEWLSPISFKESFYIFIWQNLSCDSWLSSGLITLGIFASLHPGHWLAKLSWLSSLTYPTPFCHSTFPYTKWDYY